MHLARKKGSPRCAVKLSLREFIKTVLLFKSILEFFLHLTLHCLECLLHMNTLIKLVQSRLWKKFHYEMGLKETLRKMVSCQSLQIFWHISQNQKLKLVISFFSFINLNPLKNQYDSQPFWTPVSTFAYMHPLKYCWIFFLTFTNCLIFFCILWQTLAFILYVCILLHTYIYCCIRWQEFLLCCLSFTFVDQP